MENLTSKKKYIIFIGSILLVAGLFFGFAHNVSATNIIDQEQAQLPNGAFGTHWIQTFKPSFYNISKIDFYNTFTGQIYLCKGINNLSSLTLNTTYNCGSNTFIASSSINIATFWEFNPIPVIAGSDYYFSVQNGTSTTTFNFSGDGVDRYLKGRLYADPLYLVDQTYYDMTFKTYYNDQSISILTPEEYGNYKDFPNFQILYNFATTSPATTSVKIEYGQNPALLNYSDQENVPPNIISNWAIIKTLNLFNGAWYARASLYHDSVLIATSSLRSFYINNETGTSNYLGGIATTTLSTDLCRDIDTSSFYGSIVCGLRRVIYWAFTSSDTTDQQFSATYETLKTKAPFSAFYDITGTIDTALSTTTDMTGTFSVPMIRETTTTPEFYMLPVMSSSTLPNAIGSSNAVLVRTTFSWLIWAGLATFILLRII